MGKSRRPKARVTPASVPPPPNGAVMATEYYDQEQIWYYNSELLPPRLLMERMHLLGDTAIPFLQNLIIDIASSEVWESGVVFTVECGSTRVVYVST